MIDFSSIKNKVSFLFIIFATLTTVLVMGAQLFGIPFTDIDGSIEDARQEDIRQLNQYADELQDSLNKWIEERHKDIQFIGLSSIFSIRSQIIAETTNLEALAQGNLSEAFKNDKQGLNEMFDEFFERLLTAYPEYTEIHLLHPDKGVVIASSNKKSLGQKLLETSAFAFVRNAIAPVSMLTNKEDWKGNNSIIFALPTLQERDGATPVLVFITPISNIQDTLVQFQREIGETGEILFINNYGVGVRVGDQGVEEIIETPRLREHLNSELESTRRITDLNGDIALISSRLIPVNQDQSITVFMKIDESILAQKRQERLYAGIFVILFSVGFSTLLILFIMQKFLGPLLPLTSAAETIASGKYSTRVATQGKDEIGRLGVAFNKMAGSIQEHVEELAIARDIADTALKAKAEFLATMSHEIRTPMNGVIGMADLLQDTSLQNEQKQMVRTIRQSGYALVSVINDILDFSKIEAGKLDLESIPLSIEDIIEGVAETLSPIAREKGIVLNTYIDPNIPDKVLGDPVRLRQVLFNLAGNAVKFTEEGKVFIKAYLKNSGENAVILFKVIDDGIGISKEGQVKLFEAFSQAEGSTTRRFGGTGLGLTICKNLTELMGGTLEVESELGKGSDFFTELTFPISLTDTSKRFEYNIQDLKILMVLLEEDMVESTYSYLKHEGANSLSLGTLDEVHFSLDKARKEGTPFDVIVYGLGWGDALIALQISELQDKVTTPPDRFVVMTSTPNIGNNTTLENAVILCGNPLRRESFIHAVAIAAGRASPDVNFEDEEVIGFRDTERPSQEQSEKDGQLILLAEDNRTNQLVITKQLNRLGYNCILAEDGNEALQKYKEHSFGILLTDCHMPNMDGHELTKTIRNMEKDGREKLDIIAITASVLAAEVDKCYASGMDDFLSKPLDIRDLKILLNKRLKTKIQTPKLPEKAIEPDKAIEDEQTSKSEETPSSEKTQKTPETNKKVIDTSVLIELIGDDPEVLLEIYQEYLEPTYETLEELKTCFENGDFEGVGQSAHKLKSSSRSIGANDLADLCVELEVAGKEGDLETIKNLYANLKPYSELVFKEIKEMT